MEGIINAIEGFEKFIYKVLLWFILIPKTIIKIIIDPGWATGYVSSELKQNDGNRFDEYMSPLLLFLLAILIPMLGISFVPAAGTNVIAPIEGSLNCLNENTPLPSDGIVSCMSFPDRENNSLIRVVRFEANATFISNTFSLYHEFQWRVFKCNATDCNELVGGESQNEKKGFAQLDLTQPDQVIFDNNPGNQSIQIKDNHTVGDEFYYAFRTPASITGDTTNPNIEAESEAYQVEITSKNFHYDDENNDIENNQTRTLYLYFPQISGGNPDNNVQISFSEPNQTVKQPDDPEKTLKSPKFIFLGLGLLLLPLAFSLTTNYKKGSDISELLLRDSFYVQCYYFAPVGLAVWALYYSFVFYTDDISPLVPLAVIAFGILVLIWFFYTETNTISQTRGLENKWLAFGIVIVCLVAIVGAAFFLLLIIGDADFLRKSLLWAYPILGGFITLFLVVRRFWKRSPQAPKPEGE